MKTEHPSVIGPYKYLQQQGYKVTYLSPKTNGLLDINDLKAACGNDTLLVSIMHVNNEIGVIQDIVAIGEWCESKGILFHVDAAQSAGKIPIDVSQCHMDLLTLSAHKFYGPKGVGALYLRQKPPVKLQPIIYGGGQQRDIRPGTLASHQIIAMGLAAELAYNELAYNYQHIKRLSQRVYESLEDFPGLMWNSQREHCYPGIINFSVDFIEGESLRYALDREVIVSGGSACSSASLEPSAVLKAIGRNDMLAHSALRISIGKYTTEAEIEQALTRIMAIITGLQNLSPLSQAERQMGNYHDYHWQLP